MVSQTAPVVFHSSYENECKGLGLRDAIQLGFLSYQVDNAFTWNFTSLDQSIFYLVGQKTLLDCIPPGLGLDAPA